MTNPIDVMAENTDPKLKMAAQRLTERFHPKKIYLFGSRANGTHCNESDYDLFMLVENSNVTAAERMVEARKALWGLLIAVDIFVYTEKEFDEWKGEINTIANTVYTEGRELQFGP